MKLSSFTTQITESFYKKNSKLFLGEWWNSIEVKSLRENFNSLCSKKPNNYFVD